MVTRTCECGKEFSYDPVMVGEREIIPRKWCSACMAARVENAERDKANEEKKDLSDKWEKICPPLYDDTDLNRLKLSKQVITKVLAWRPETKGVALAGETGAGKTRLMFYLLKQLHFMGLPVVAISAKKFERYCHQMFDKDNDAKDHIKKASTAKVLFVDDIGKEKYTERVESEFYELIEQRTSHLLPTIWTSNCSGEELAGMMSEDRGIPIIRRLREFTDIITV